MMSSPDPPPPPPPPPNPPTLANAQVQMAGLNQRRGRPSTIATTPAGLITPASTAGKTLLGQ